MSVLIIGADNLGSIPKNLAECGLATVSHITGRSAADKKECIIGCNTALIIVLINFVNHGVAGVIKKQAKKQGVPIVFARRSWPAIQEKINALGVDMLFKQKAI